MELTYVNGFNMVKTIAFDADDTLWVNETYFRDTEKDFYKLVEEYGPEEFVQKKLYEKEIENLENYGYGIKGFMLSMLECALEISNNKLSADKTDKILLLGKEMLQKPIELLDGVEEVLQKLQGRFRLVVTTKGDLLDQEKKVEKSGLLKYFDEVIVMSDKKEKDYQKVIQRLKVSPEELLVIGNSLKSDVLPVINIGASAIHIPFHTTWQHEMVASNEKVNKEYTTLTQITELLEIL